MRKAFSLVTAIFLLVLISTLMAIMLSLSSQTLKQTGDIYLQEQAKLLARSATEYALLAISAHKRDANHKCVENINMHYPNPSFDVNVSIYYIGKNLPCDNSNILDNNISTKESNVTVIVDTFVTSLDSLEDIRYHKRTIQKP